MLTFGMAGSIAVPCSDTGRYSAFADSLANLDRPDGTVTRFAVCTWRQRGRNQLVRWMLDAGDEWLLFLDDDHVFAPDLLTRLLSHDEPVVAGLCLRRDEPYGPFCFQSVVSPGVFMPVDLNTYDPGELVPVAAVGTGAMLIRREVFETLPDPWFRIAESGEDMLFCQAATAAGFPVYVDLGASVGHLTTAVVWPAHTDHRWHAGIVVSGETRFTRPLPKPEPLQA